jgi:hypothetical protein
MLVRWVGYSIIGKEGFYNAEKVRKFNSGYRGGTRLIIQSAGADPGEAGPVGNLGQ